MRVGVLDCGAGYEGDLLKYYLDRQHSAKLLSPDELMECLPLSFLPHSSTEDTHYDCFLLNIKASLVVEKLIEFVLSNYEGSIWRPKLVLISNFLSWSGKRYYVPVGGSLTEFTSRVPSAHDVTSYKLENKYHSCATITGMQMCLISTGLLYGGSGYDLHNLFRAIWESNKEKSNKLFSESNGKNYVPMIHYKDLVELTGQLTLLPTFPSFFIPATDGCPASLYTIAEYLSTATKRTVGVTNRDEAIEIILNAGEADHPSPAFPCPHSHWNLDMRFTDSARFVEGVFFSYPNGMIDFVSEVWKEFIAACATEPCSFLIVGPPSSMKTTVSKELATRLGISYIDPVEAMKFVVATEDSHDPQERVGSSRATDVNHTLDLAEITEPSVALKIELGRVIAVQINGEKKKGKVDDTPIDLKTVNWTSTLVAAVPSDLVRRCAKLKIQDDFVCVRSGYVLDLWQHMKDLENIYEVTGTIPNMDDPEIKRVISQQQSFSLEGFDEGSPNSKSSKSPRPANSKSSPLAQKLPQLIIELQSPDSVTTDRVLASLGCEVGVKLNKEQQAIMKDLESRLSLYSSKLVEVTQRASTLKTAPVLRTLDELGYNIRRVDVGQVNGRGEGDAFQRIKKSTGKIVDKIYEEYVTLFGKLPWMIDLDTCDSSSLPPLIEPVDNTSNLLSIDRSSPVPTAEAKIEGKLQRASQPTINERLDGLNPDVRQRIVHNANDLQNYLVENVLSHVAEAMIHISRERVEDPVLYLANFLYHRGIAVQELETTTAYEKFLTAVHQAEAMEEEAAAQLLALSRSSKQKGDSNLN